MKVVLPDSSELELPDGATGLDAARAIGPKLAKDAVLVRTDGRVQDLRLPLEDGRPIQILTTRDTDDPDALYVLRHSTAHLLAEAVRRVYPGVKVAIGPPIENGFYYDFEFPEPIHESDLERIEEEMRRELAEGRSWERREVTAEEARHFFAEQGEPYKVELVETAEGPISFYRQDDFTDLCRGPHLQDSSPIKAVKLTGLAGAYWRGDEHNKQLTRIYGTAFYTQADPTPTSSGSRRRASATIAGSGASSICSASPSTRPARPSGIRRAWSSGTSSRICVAARTPAAATRR
jgi:threonyl-tRNA synthetase